MKKAPAIFIAHGSPMIAIKDITYTRKLISFGAFLKNIDAILVVSAHWVTEEILISGSEHPETIHDFYGFPKELYDLKYPCSGSPETARLIKNTLSDINIQVVERGLDHGAWQVMRFLVPEVGVPTFQLSINARLSFKEHYVLANKLKFLRDRNIAILGSGNIVHNLSIVDWKNQFAKPVGWAKEFHDLVKCYLETGDNEGLINISKIGELYKISAPTPEHYIPLLYVIGSRDNSEEIKILTDEFQHGSISMLSFGFGI